MGVLVHVPAALGSFGLEPEPIVTRAGLTMTQLENPDSVIPYIALDRLVKICTAETGCPHFGLLVGQQGGLETLGPLGLMMQHADQVATGLRDLVLYLHIHDCGAVPDVDLDGDRAVLSYSVYEPGVEASDQIADGAMAIAFNIMKSLCGPTWTATEVTLARSAPADVRPYRRFYKSPVRFNSEQASVMFSAQWLRQTPPLADAERYGFIQARLKESLSKDDLTFAEQVRRVLRTRLMHGRVSTETVARLFNLHRRALGRRLEREGTSFEEILKQVRFEMAKQLISDTDLPLSQIAMALNYAEPSVLTRAFRKWSGNSPSDWRTRRARTA